MKNIWKMFFCMKEQKVVRCWREDDWSSCELIWTFPPFQPQMLTAWFLPKLINFKVNACMVQINRVRGRTGQREERHIGKVKRFICMSLIQRICVQLGKSPGFICLKHLFFLHIGSFRIMPCLEFFFFFFFHKFDFCHCLWRWHFFLKKISLEKL